MQHAAAECQSFGVPEHAIERAHGVAVRESVQCAVDEPQREAERVAHGQAERVAVLEAVGITDRRRGLLVASAVRGQLPPGNSMLPSG